MMTPEINALLTRVENGAPMGRLLKEYWVLACRSAKLEREGAPERVRLFGKNFLAYRGSGNWKSVDAFDPPAVAAE